MGAPIDDTATLSTIADAIIRDPLETPTGVMKRLGMDKSARTRVLRKWARHRTKLLREAKRREVAENVYRTKMAEPPIEWGWQQSHDAPPLATSRTEAGIAESDLYLVVPEFPSAPETPPEPPRRPLWKRLLGIAP